VATHSEDVLLRRVHVGPPDPFEGSVDGSDLDAELREAGLLDSWPDDAEVQTVSATDTIMFEPNEPNIRDIPFCDADVDTMEASARVASYATGGWPEGEEVGPRQVAIIQLRWIATVRRNQAEIAKLRPNPSSDAAEWELGITSCGHR